MPRELGGTANGKSSGPGHSCPTHEKKKKKKKQQKLFQQKEGTQQQILPNAARGGPML